MDWRKQDWYWLTGILIFFNLLFMSFRLSDNQTFMNIFSFMVNGISIALAFVAMYISFKQNSDNQTLTNQMSETLARMDEKINNLDNKVSNLDPKFFIDKEKNVLIDDLKKIVNNDDSLLKEIENKVSEKFNNLSIELEEAINHHTPKTNKNSLSKKALNILKNNRNLQYRDLTLTLAMSESIPLGIAENVVDELIMRKFIYEDDKNNLFIHKVSQ